MEWILIVMMFYGGDSGNHMLKVEGFTTQQACQEAAETVQTMGDPISKRTSGLYRDYYRIHTSCIEKK